MNSLWSKLANIKVQGVSWPVVESLEDVRAFFPFFSIHTLPLSQVQILVPFLRGDPKALNDCGAKGMVTIVVNCGDWDGLWTKLTYKSLYINKTPSF